MAACWRERAGCTLLQAMERSALRWNRGCGSGIGFSGHKNDYQEQVCVNNYLEDRAGTGLAAEGKHYLGFKGEGSFVSQYQAGYNRADGELAAHRAAEPPPPPPKASAEDKGQRLIFDHGDPYEPQFEASASLGSLAFDAPALGKKQVHQELWAGSKHHDFGVTVAKKPTTRLQAKQQEWADQQHAFMSTYTSAQRLPQMVSALQYVGREGATKRALIKPDSTAEQGQAAQVGRKAKGEFVDERNKSFYKLDFRHPIPYTVKLQTLPAALAASDVQQC